MWGGRLGDVSVNDIYQKTLFAVLYSFIIQQNVSYL